MNLHNDLLDRLADLDDDDQHQLAADLKNILDALQPAPGGYDAALRERLSELADLLT